MQNRLGIVFAALVAMLPVVSDAGCLVTRKTCIDPGATRVIDGIAVTRDCWGYEEEKTCLKEETGVDGCKTLSDDEAASGPGACKRIELTCEESVTDVDGKTVCLKEAALYRCDKQIELPLLNATWKGVVTETEKTPLENTCETFENNAACVRVEIKDEGNTVTQTYTCSDENLAACTELVELGCTRLKKPSCDSATDPTCALKVGRVRCSTDAFTSYVENGSATILSSTERVDSKAQADRSSVKALEKDGATCTVIASECTDENAGWRVVNGNRVYATCWAYKETVLCRDTRESSTCRALEADSRCRQTSSACDAMIDGVCAKETRQFTCTGSADSVFEGAGEVLDEIEITDGVASLSTCADIDSDAACRLTAKSCEEESENGCKKYALTYACGQKGEVVTKNDCRDLSENPACRLEGTECTGYDAAGHCTMATRRYVCEAPEKTLEIGQVCDDTVCINGVCQKREEANTDAFLQSAALLEVAREAASYADAGKGTVFEGIASGCTVKAAGFSCCKRADAADAAELSNSAFEVAVTAGVDAGFELIKTVGSPYVYDVLSSHEALSSLLTNLYGEAGTGVYSPNFSFYGVSVARDAAGSLTMNFSPAAFFAAVAMQYLTEYFTCTKEDQLHAMREAAGLCRYVGSYCAKKSGLGCLEKKESWVCFNSRLARLVQEGARWELNLGWGTPEEPLTRGITFEELRRLDFTKIDLTAAIGEVSRVNAAKLTGQLPDASAANARMKTRVSDLTTSGKAPYEAYSTVTGKCYTASGTPTHCASITASP